MRIKRTFEEEADTIAKDTMTLLELPGKAG